MGIPLYRILGSIALRRWMLALSNRCDRSTLLDAGIGLFDPSTLFDADMRCSIQSFYTTLDARIEYSIAPSLWIRTSRLERFALVDVLDACIQWSVRSLYAVSCVDWIFDSIAPRC